MIMIMIFNVHKTVSINTLSVNSGSIQEHWSRSASRQSLYYKFALYRYYTNNAGFARF